MSAFGTKQTSVERSAANVERDVARRMAANIAKLPDKTKNKSPKNTLRPIRNIGEMTRTSVTLARRLCEKSHL
jgi:hypothetical protein